MCIRDRDSILWEAPQKPQQVWFINELGANVNLGNIAPNEVISLETLRVGVRGDTFFNYLPKGINVNKVIENCLLYTSDAADDLLCVDLGGRRILKKKKKEDESHL
eukprot:TRINITY_DN15125_c0_g1_i1.p1 TRINITY_DN15125_c0_g1~~TRINITY_DN15125_c0_g1_i1.p1  ORF type:complete len:106 (-),score=33.21 TRINITY_DN15125_c0_g1_i1:43-360(-)